MDAIRDNLRAWALHFAARGWHIFPITPGAKKPPVINRWETRASIDPDQIHRWWQHTAYTVGIATGPSGLVVIDLDTCKYGQTVPQRWANLGISSGAGVLRAHRAARTAQRRALPGRLRPRPTHRRQTPRPTHRPDRTRRRCRCPHRADCDCTPREVARVIAAGLAAGTRNPRRITPRTSQRRAA